MRDKNFFEPYVDDKNKKDEKRKMVTIIGGGMAILVLSYVLFNVVRIPMLKKEISRISDELNENQLVEKKESVENKKQILEELKQIEIEIDYVSAELNEKDRLGVYLVETITNSMPSEVFLSTISLNEDLITVEGVSRTKEDIAQLEANLRQVVYFKDVFIPAIATEEGFYKFSITMSLTEEGMLEQEKSQEVEVEVEDASDDSETQEDKSLEDKGEDNSET